MNKWKIAFLALASLVILIIVSFIYLATSPTDNTEIPRANTYPEENVLVVQTTTKEFESIAQKYLAEAVEDQAMEVSLKVEDQIYIFSELIIFGITIPIQMDFDPVVYDGNIRLQQTKVHVGKKNIPPSTVLKLLNDAVEFPNWIVVRPNEEEIYIDLSRLNIADGNRVRAKEIDLAGDKILLEIIVPGSGSEEKAS